MDTNEWTWVAGTLGINAQPTYGDKGVPHPFNDPGARMSGCLWEGFDGSVYHFGGSYIVSQSDFGKLL